MVVVAVAQLYAPSTLCTTHTHTPSVLLTWLMDELQRRDTFGWVTVPEGSLFKKISISAQSLELNLSYTAALCCLFTKLQLERRASPRLFSFSQSVGQNLCHFKNILARQPCFPRDHLCTEKDSSSTYKLCKITTIKKNTCEGDKHTYWQ